MLKINGLDICFNNNNNKYIAVKDMSFEIQSGQILGLVGESGCGKSITALALMGLLPPLAEATCEKLIINNKEIKNINSNSWKELRGREISMVFQEPMTTLNPVISVGKQIQEAYAIHNKCNYKKAYEVTIEMMKKVGLSRVDKLYKSFPFELSGGMRQRIVIALALINNPGVVIADEPTTALDVTIEAQILELLKTLNSTINSSVLFISHNLGIINGYCKNVVIMYAGYIVEMGPTEQIFRNPKHPYTMGLLAAIPTPDKKGKELYSINGYVSNLLDRRHDRCCFVDRCNFAVEECRLHVPPLKTIENNVKVRCFRANEVTL